MRLVVKIEGGWYSEGADAPADNSEGGGSLQREVVQK